MVVSMRKMSAGAGTVVDLDPVRLVQAQHDGCRVAKMAAALSSASVIVTATGFDGVLGEQQLSQVADGAIMVNVGHSDREIDVDWLGRHPSTPVRRHLERFELDGRRVYLLNWGGKPGQPGSRARDQRSPRPLETRVARALATGSV